MRAFIPRKVRAAVWDKTNGYCWYCGNRIEHPVRDFEVDHVIPVSDGGSDDIENLVPSCRTCNQVKGAGPADDLRVHFFGGLFYGEAGEYGGL